MQIGDRLEARQKPRDFERGCFVADMKPEVSINNFEDENAECQRTSPTSSDEDNSDTGACMHACWLQACANCGMESECIPGIVNAKILPVPGYHAAVVSCRQYCQALQSDNMKANAPHASQSQLL